MLTSKRAPIFALAVLVCACTEKKSSSTPVPIASASPGGTPSVGVSPPQTSGGGAPSPSTANPVVTSTPDPQLSKSFPGDYGTADLSSKQAQDVFTKADSTPPYHFSSATKDAWFESLDGRTTCLIGYGRTFWTTTVPVFKTWEKDTEALLDVSMDKDFYADVYTYYDASTTTIKSNGTRGIGNLLPCPITGARRIRVKASDFVPFTNPDALAYAYPNATVQLLVANRDTFLSGTFNGTKDAVQQKGGHGCVIPAKSIFAVTYKVVQLATGVGQLPVELFQQVPGGSGDLCAAGAQGYIPLADFSRVL